MRLAINQFATGAILLLAQMIPTVTVWFLIVVFGLAGMADRDWFVDVTFSREDLIDLLGSMRTGLPAGWPWGKLKTSEKVQKTE